MKDILASSQQRMAKKKKNIYDDMTEEEKEKTCRENEASGYFESPDLFPEEECEALPVEDEDHALPAVPRDPKYDRLLTLTAQLDRIVDLNTVDYVGGENIVLSHFSMHNLIHHHFR